MSHENENHQKKPTAAERERLAFLDDIRVTFASPSGQRVLAWFRFTAAIASPAYTPGGNVNDAIWRDGRKSVALELEKLLKEADAAYGSAGTPVKPKAVRGRAARQ